jgi:hypothetical protein
MTAVSRVQLSLLLFLAAVFTAGLALFLAARCAVVFAALFAGFTRRCGEESEGGESEDSQNRFHMF